MRHLISPLDLSIEELNEILSLGHAIMQNPEKYSHVCDGKKLATLFYEPSTRTRLSFEAAMLRVISSYADICAMRHPKEGAPTVASMYSEIPVINAGDGGHNHPTQTLTDLLTIKTLKGRLDNMTIGMCGDLKFGRTVHSLINAMVRYENVRFILISPNELKIPDYLRQEVLDAKNIEYVETNELEKYMPELDILYMTRVQRERFFNEEDYIRLKDSFILDSEKMKLARDDMYVLHPLPRNFNGCR